MDDAKRDELSKLLRRGLNHYGLGELEAAIAYWERVCNLDPDNEAARDYLTSAYEEMGRPAEAADQYTAFLTAWANADEGLPQVEDVRKRLAALQQAIQ